MAETIWETGKLTDVWTPVGKDANGAPRFRRANYDVLNWAPNGVPETFVVPLGTERINSAEVALKPDGSGQIGQEFGYYTGDTLFLEPQGDSQADTLQALHSFGFV